MYVCMYVLCARVHVLKFNKIEIIQQKKYGKTLVKMTNSCRH